jgi:hypothetical protein
MLHCGDEKSTPPKLDSERAVVIVSEAAEKDFSEVNFINYIGFPMAMYNPTTEKWRGYINIDRGLTIDLTIDAEWQFRNSFGTPRQSYDPPPSGEVTVFEITYTITSEGEGMNVTTYAQELFTDIYENSYFAFDYESSATTSNKVEGEDKYVVDLQISGLKYDSRVCGNYPYEGIVDGYVSIEGVGSATVTIDYDYLDDCDRAFIKVTISGNDYCYDYDLIEGKLTKTICE